MFGFFSNGILPSGLMRGMIDCHSHILPGVDDGVRSQEESLGILSYFESLGIQKVKLTPHVMEDYPLNTRSFLEKNYQTLREAYSGGIELSLSAEYMLDSAFGKLLDTEQELMTIFDNYILVETSHIFQPVNFDTAIDKIHSRGYHVVLAHPERYLYMDIPYYAQLKERNIKFQLNLLSLSGAYGNQVRIKSEKLLHCGYYDCVGSDIHSFKSFKKRIEQATLSKTVIKRIDSLKDQTEILYSL